MRFQSFVLLTEIQTVMRQPVVGILTFTGRWLGLGNIFYAFLHYMLLVFDVDCVVDK